MTAGLIVSPIISSGVLVPISLILTLGGFRPIIFEAIFSFRISNQIYTTNNLNFDKAYTMLISSFL